MVGPNKYVYRVSSTEQQHPIKSLLNFNLVAGEVSEMTWPLRRNNH